jgi:hypothetical protein
MMSLNSFVRWPLLMAVVALFARGHIDVGRAQAFAQGSPPAFDCMAIIDGLASKNQKPAVPKGLSFESSVRFPRNYDFKDQDRVLENFAKLANDPSEELWECLLAHTDDKRYALTMGYNSPYRENYTVGRLCGWMAYQQVLFVKDKYSERDITQHKRHLKIPIDDLPKWRKARADKKLWELQLEAIELAWLAVTKDDELDQKDKARMKEEMRTDIRKLLTEKKPFHFGIGFDAFDIINPIHAKFQEK